MRRFREVERKFEDYALARTEARNIAENSAPILQGPAPTMNADETKAFWDKLFSDDIDALPDKIGDEDWEDEIDSLPEYAED